MSKRKIRNKISIVIMIVLVLNLITSFYPFLNLTKAQFNSEFPSIVVDGNKDDWIDIEPLGKSTRSGFQSFNIGNLYLTNDSEYLYFWVDALNVPNWGEHGQYINIALQINNQDSGVSANPWSSQFNFEGTEKKPQYHIAIRVKNDKDINGAALYSAEDLYSPILASWDDLKGAEFAVDLDFGFEGKIPVKHLNIKEGDEISAIVVLSGNKDDHGAFDVIPENPRNEIADDWNERSQPNVQSVYSDPYVVTGLSDIEPTPEFKSPVINDDGTITFYYKGSDSVKSVFVPGSFNGWSTSKEAMKKGEDGIWSLTLELDAGIYEYRYYIDGRWMDDPLNDLKQGDNNVVIVPGLITELPDEIEVGTELPLSGFLLDKTGDKEEVKISWQLESSISGVSIIDNKLIISDEASIGESIPLVGTYGTYTLRHSIKILESLNEYIINYYRFDDKQMNWDMWIWEDGKDGNSYSFTRKTEDGFAQITVKFSSSKINVITRPGNWSEQEMDRIIEMPEGQTSVEVWIIQGDPTVYYKREEVDLRPKIQSAFMEDYETVLVTTISEIKDDVISDFKLIDRTSGKEIPIQVIRESDKKVILKIEDSSEIDVRYHYSVVNPEFKSTDVLMRGILDNRDFYYDGDDLGLTYTKEKSTFKVWAPTAMKVSVVLYENAGEYNDAGIVEDHTGGQEIEMVRSDNGVWSKTIGEDLKGKFYMYKIEFADGSVHYAVDPYAKAVSANGQRSAIVDLSSTNPKNWKPEEKPGMVHPTDAIIYELHVRDFSINENSGIKNKGKYLAFTETGTTDSYGNSTGIDHLKELGITHVHLLPVYDFKTVNELTVDDPESTNPKFNWGYDPQNYNVPEGSYSTNPKNPSTRIIEFKQMVQALHDHGIRVIMDVVYNHTYEIDNGPFNKIVPGYFYRTTDIGYANGSGVGNEIATERPMVRKYIVDSVRYWAEEYNIDGFRFDLMGLIDINTMKEIEHVLHNQVDPTILIYGEPWQAGGSPLPHELQTVKGTQKDKNFAVFNDHFRSAIKGGSDDASKGFATGEYGKEGDIVTGVQGSIYDFTNSPTETINYVTAHDNLNLWDKIIKTMGLEEAEGWFDIRDGQLVGESANKFHSVEEAVANATPYHAVDLNNVLANETVKRSLLANGIVLTSQGIPFIHAGDELLRTKYGDHNSYKSPDAVNQIRWEHKEKFKEVFDYYAGLIELRKSHPAFRMTTKEAIEKNLAIYRSDGNVVVFELKDFANGDNWKNIVVIYNANTSSQTINLPKDTQWNIVVNHQAAGTEVIETVQGNTVKVEPLSIMVLYDEARDYTPEVSSIAVSTDKIGLKPGEARVVHAIVQDQYGNPMTDTPINWESSDESVAVVTKNGKITAVADGKAIITVFAGNVKETIEVMVGELKPTTITIIGTDVLYEGYETQLTAIVQDQFGQEMANEEVVWSSSDTSIATVDSSGKVKGLYPGTVKITAEVADIEKSITITVKEYKQRYIDFYYFRPNGDYEGWNIWTWNTGVADGEILFEEITEKGARGKINIGPMTTSIGFVLRKGQNWEEKDAYSLDRYISVSPTDRVTKVYVTTGVGEFYTVPFITGPEIKDGSITFYYRDADLFEQNKMQTIEKVQVKVNGQIYDMTYNEQEERFTFTLTNVQEGIYEYTYLVTIGGNTKEISDPYNTENGKSVVEFKVPKIAISAEVKPRAISYNENAVITVHIENPENVGIKEIFVDSSNIGGSEQIFMDPELNKLTISVRDNIPAGVKELPIVVVDEYGNHHQGTANVEVKARIFQSEWDFDWDEARIYFILTDRFFDGDPTNNPSVENGYDPYHSEAFHGGDIQGIIDKLDYLKKLGINTIWITPIVDNIDFNQGADLKTVPELEPKQYAYHGYWTKDFETMDPYLGDIETMKKLIDKAHDYGIKIMVDVVVNHAGYGTEDIFGDMLRENPGSSDLDMELSGLPDFRTEDPDVREKIIEWQTTWLEKLRTDRGDTIDYFRVDTVKHVDNTTWKSFKNKLTEISPSFKLIGEYWGASYHNVFSQLRTGQMDSLLDFDFKNQALKFVLDGKVEEVEKYLQERNALIDNTAMLGQYLSSHDEDGFLTQIGGDIGKLLVAASLQITAKGQPVIYYGEELGRTGSNGWNTNDKGEYTSFHENRGDMPWELYENKESKAMKIYNHYQKLLHIRKDYSKIFSKGERTFVDGGDTEQYSIHMREYNGEKVYVGLNIADDSRIVTFKVDYEPGAQVIDLYQGIEYTVNVNQELIVEIPGKDDGGTIILVSKKEKENPTNPGETPGESGEVDTTDPNETSKEPGQENPTDPGQTPEDPKDEKSTAPGDENPIKPGESPEELGPEKPTELGQTPKELKNKNITVPRDEVSGEELPNTSTNYWIMMFYGTIFIVTGLIVYTYQRRANKHND